MFDLHAHILPGIDDGARTPEETLEMSRAAANCGSKTVLATPHRKDVTENWSVDHLNRLIDEMNAQNREQGVDLSLLLGMENHLSPDLPNEIEAGRALTMNGSRYILVEMPFFGRPDWVEDTLSGIQDQYLTPVLAHPERIEAFQQDPDLLARNLHRARDAKPDNRRKRCRYVGRPGQTLHTRAAAQRNGPRHGLRHPCANRHEVSEARNWNRGGCAPGGAARRDRDGDRHTEGYPR